MYHFKNYVIKIMSTSPVSYVFTLQGKLKPTEKKNLHITRFLLIFSVYQ